LQGHHTNERKNRRKLRGGERLDGFDRIFFLSKIVQNRRFWNRHRSIAQSDSKSRLFGAIFSSQQIHLLYTSLSQTGCPLPESEQVS
jgi:hypothetical protein